MVKERVARKRYERTMTMKEKSDKMAKQFDQLLTHNEKEGLTQDEKMALAAKKMQEKFRMEEELVNEGKKSTVRYDVFIGYCKLGRDCVSLI